MSEKNRQRIDRAATVNWMTPNIYKEEPLDCLKISLMHVRAANDIEIEFSGERDGWVIYVTVTTGYKDSGKGYLEGIEERREKAFIPAWDEDEWDENQEEAE